MAAVTTVVEGFSISHAAILNGSTGIEEADGDIFGVREGSLNLEMDSYDNTGDDAVLSSWYWFNYATVTVHAGYIPFKLIALLTGETMQSSGTGSNTQYSIPLWTQAQLNVTAKPMLIRVPSKDTNGNIRVLDVVLYKVQFAPISFNGPTYKDGMLVNYSGKALVSDVDEKGTSLGAGIQAIGRIITHA